MREKGIQPDEQVSLEQIFKKIQQTEETEREKN